MKKNLVLIALVLTMVCSCGLFSKDTPPSVLEPTRVVLELDAAGDINPNIAGRPSPLVLHIYHLRSYSAFNDAEFISLYQDDKEVLGGDLIDKHELFLKPNEKRTVYFEATDDLRTIGILAAFRYFDQGQWKAAAGVQKNKTNVFNVSVRGTNVQIK